MKQQDRLVNPFVVGRYAGKEYFCDRVEETAILRKQIENGRDVALISQRRLGKTGLIHHLFAQEEFASHRMCFFVDILSTSSLAEMVYLLGKAIFEKLKTRGRRWIDGFISLAQSLKAAFSIDPLTGEPSFQISIGEIIRPDITLDEIFSYLNSAPQPCVVAIDEFQQIGTYPEKGIEAILRNRIQQCSNARFIFAGSQRHVMTNMFATSARPFYQSAVMMHLGPISENQYEAFAVEKFKNYGKELPLSAFQTVYAFVDGITWYVQLILNELFALTQASHKAEEQLVETALRNLVDLQKESYLLLLSRLTTRQREVLVAIAREGKASGVMSAKFIKHHALGSPSIVQSALRSLLAQDLVRQNSLPDTYQLSDPLFSRFLLHTY